MTDPHDHEFHEEDADWSADENLLCSMQCMHRPVYGSQYSERHDEVFYDEGPRCEASKRILWEFDGVYFDRDANIPVEQETGLIELPYDDEPYVWEQAVEQAEWKVNDTRHPNIDPESDEVVIPVVIEGDRYEVRWSNRTENIEP